VLLIAMIILILGRQTLDQLCGSHPTVDAVADTLCDF